METESAPQSHDWLTKAGVKFYRFKSLIKRRWWVLLLTVSLGLAYEGWVLFNKETRYLSIGKLMVSGGVSSGDSGRFSEQWSGFYQTQIKIIVESKVQRQAQQKLEMEKPNLQGEAKIVAELDPRTNIFLVKGIGSNPEYAKAYVDAVMEEFLNYKRVLRLGRSGVMAENISEEMKRLSDKMDGEEKALQEFMEKNNMIAWTEQKNTAAKFLNDLQTREATLQTELLGLENLSAEELMSRGGSAPQQGGPPASETPYAAELKAQYIQATQQLIQQRAEYGEKSRIWKPKHPRLITLQQDIATIERTLKTLELQNQQSSLSRMSSIKAELESLKSSIASWEEKALEAGRKDFEYKGISGAVARTTGLYEKLASSMTELQVADTDTENVQIMESASQARVIPHGVVRHLSTGLVVGLLLGVVILVLLDRTDDRFSSSSEVIEHFSEPILAQIADVQATRTEAGLPLLALEDDRYAFAEAFRSLRSSLVFMPNQGELRSLIVTSSIPGEGKSTIASNLAITMALAGAKVVLVDADLRRGDLAHLFDTDGRTGLSSVLRGEAEWRASLQKTKYPTLDLLPRGPVTNQSSELLLLPTVHTLLADLKANYDLVIFNTSPILATDDTPTLAPNFDGTLMVVRAQFTSARLVHNALNNLYQRQINVLGFILNCVDAEMPDYYYYRYPKYYAA